MMTRSALVLAMALSMSGCIWSSVGPPLPIFKKHNEMMERYYEEKYPTTVQIVDGRVLHPSTGRPVNCQVMAPFEEHAQDLLDLAAPFRAWSWDVTVAIGGGSATVFGLHRGYVRQGIAMSRACRSLTTLGGGNRLFTPPGVSRFRALARSNAHRIPPGSPHLS